MDSEEETTTSTEASLSLPSKRIGIAAERDVLYIKTGIGRFPIATWWVVVLMAFLLPVALFGAIVWTTGRIIQWRYSDEGEVPKDAQVFKTVGWACFQFFLLPALLHLRFVKPLMYRAWRSTRPRAGFNERNG